MQTGRDRDSFDNILDRVTGAKGFGGRLALLISVLLCCSASLSAQENHVIEISGGIAGLYTMTDSTVRVLSTSSSPPQITVDGFLTGWSTSAATNVYHNVLVVGDISSHYTGGYWHNGIQVGPPYCFGGPCGPNYYIPSVRTRAYLFGPRFSSRLSEKNAFFAQGLFGSVRRTTGDTSASGKGMAFGGGYDRTLFGPVGLRFQADYMPSRTDGKWNNDTRIGLGVLFHFGF
jgi:hypothetical protein